jgi:hypothetical protein
MSAEAQSADIDFTAPLAGEIQLEGNFATTPAGLAFQGPGAGAITILNTAREVYLEASSSGGTQVVGVREDGPPLDRAACGDDCDEDPDRGAATRVGERREYWIVRRDELETHELTFEIEAPGLVLHRLRFR